MIIFIKNILTNYKMKRISFVVAILLGLAVANTEVPKAPVVSAPIA
jgi:hypothetical protein